jgi:hypothetical protein
MYNKLKYNNKKRSKKITITDSRDKTILDKKRIMNKEKE